MSNRNVGYVCASDPLDVHSFSGTRMFMLRALEGAGWNVVPLGRAMVRKRPLHLKAAKALRKLGLPTLPRHYDEDQHVQQIADDAARHDVSVAVAPAASSLVARWPVDAPIVHLSDATPRLLRGYYEPFSDTPPPPEDEFQREDAIERRALQRADAVSFSSDWAADSAVQDYDVPRERVHVIPYGANVEDSADEATIRGRDLTGRCEMLFIGKYWQRKGGDIAVAAAEALTARGVQVRLHLVGVGPADGTDLPACVEHHGFINKAEQAGRDKLRRLLTQSHFFILPTRADCTPVAINEANAYGLPAISTTTGGVPTLVQDGRTGILMDLTADLDAWADRIAEVWADPDRYLEMALAARRFYDQRLNWPAWGQSMSHLLQQLQQR